MLNLQDYKVGKFENKEFKGGMGTQLFQIDPSTKHDAEIIKVGNKNVEVFKAKGDNLLQVCAEYTIDKGMRSFGGMACFDEIDINREAIVAYCEKNGINLRCELQSWSTTRCLVATSK